MTQEELDSLMNSDTNLDDVALPSVDESNSEAIVDDSSLENYRVEADAHWPPPPPSQEHKVVNQLDDVTRDSEKKAVELMDKLELMDKYFSQAEFILRNVEENINKNLEVFTVLNEKFPQVKTFKDLLDKNNASKSDIQDIVSRLQDGQNEVLVAMDSMQYQDIHRQKIERVINVMRALNRYISSLFDSKKDDSTRVSSAVHINGDSTEDVVTNDDIEQLIANLGHKK
ncbi:chemotaxis protein [Campylobacter avium]|uniref:chemotaxis protein n=1 Tax=Campylobacter avium TaxID=522485 RepID=UPI00255B88D7|nr:chemotaxis protein [Campylobacter avium]